MNWVLEQAKRGMNARTYVLLGLLAVTLVYVQSLDEQQKRARERSRVAGGTPPPVAVAAVAPKTGITTPTEPGWGRDPFERGFDTRARGQAPAARRPAAPTDPGIFLQGVMKGPSGRTALINGEVYREGERVGNREVLQIGTRSVLLLDRGTVKTFTLKGERP
jgi:hypothetical protein